MAYSITTEEAGGEEDNRKTQKEEKSPTEVLFFGFCMCASLSVLHPQLYIHFSEQMDALLSLARDEEQPPVVGSPAKQLETRKRVLLFEFTIESTEALMHSIHRHVEVHV